MTPLDRLAAIVAGMTPGEWTRDNVEILTADGQNTIADCIHGRSLANAAGIVALRNAAEELIAVARAAQKIRPRDGALNCNCDACKLAKALAALEAKLAGERGA